MIEKIENWKIVPVVAIERASDAERLADALSQGGLPVAEITLRTDAGLQAISKLADRADFVVGAGTVHSVEQAKQVADAGAKFVVSPGFNPKTVQWCLDRSLPIFPGVSSPTDLETAIEFGLSIVKFFPAEQLGGVAMLKALQGPYGDIRFMPTGGIDAALSDTTPDVVIEAVNVAKKHGTIVSYDLNYRPSLWKGIGGHAKAQQVNREIAKSVDVMIGNEEDFTACLGLEVEGVDEHLGNIDVTNFKRMIEKAVIEFPNFIATGTTLREVHSATINDWSAIVWYDGEFYESQAFTRLEILDRVGGGDSFASGLMYGFLATGDADKAVNYRAAHGALAMTTPGDTTMVTVDEVEKVMAGGGARVVR